MDAPVPRIRVAALAVEGDRILLVLHRSGKKEYYLLPGGGIEKGETDGEALKRELLEETGLAATPVRLLFQTESVSPDKSRHIIQKVYLTDVSGGITKSRDKRVVKAVMMKRADFATVKFYPNIREHILSAWDKSFPGPAMLLRVPWED